MRAAGPVVALILVTAIWGWTFVVVRVAVHAYPVVPYLSLRFLLATLLLTPVLLRRGTGVRQGVLPGVALSAAYLAQTEGLRFTTASRAGLLTGLFVVITPLLSVVVLRFRPPTLTIVAAATAMIGTALLALVGSGSSGQLRGDALEVLTAVALSVHILLLARIPRVVDASRVALTQMALAALIFTGGTVALGGFPSPTPSVWGAVAITGALASALAFYVQTFVQQRISPGRTAVILTAEPAFATFFGVLLAGDFFSPVQGVGAGLILLALAAHEILPLVRSRRQAGEFAGPLGSVESDRESARP